MSYLNTPIPVVEAYIRGNFLRNQEDSHDKKFPCYIFGMSSIPAQALSSSAASTAAFRAT
jgi:hypothetical protein